jgi:transcriptional regulator with XRE-family HTH domain
MPWIPKGATFRAERERRGLNIATVARKAGVAEKTLQRIEQGKQQTIWPDTLRAIAQVLGCEMDRLATQSHHHPRNHAAARAAPPLEKKPSPSPPRTERPRPLTAKALHDIRTAFRVHEKKLFVTTGRLRAQAALTATERIALGCPQGVGARFALARGTGRGTFRITLYTTNLATTSQLQSGLDNTDPIKVVARLVVVETSAEHPTVSENEDLDRYFFRKNWRGFSLDGEEEKVPWALVVEEPET